MSDVTQILRQIDAGDPSAADRLLPLVYDELRKLAAARMARESPGHTLQPTALVHEVYVRLVKDADQQWDDRGHFFAAAAEAMRRILVESARRKGAAKHGAHFSRIELDEVVVNDGPPATDLLALDEALGEFEQHDPQAAALVKLRYFAGLSHVDAAAALGVSRRAADRLWALARAWLFAGSAKAAHNRISRESSGKLRAAGTRFSHCLPDQFCAQTSRPCLTGTPGRTRSFWRPSNCRAPKRSGR